MVEDMFSWAQEVSDRVQEVLDARLPGGRHARKQVCAQSTVTARECYLKRATRGMVSNMRDGVPSAARVVRGGGTGKHFRKVGPTLPGKLATELGLNSSDGERGNSKAAPRSVARKRPAEGSHDKAAKGAVSARPARGAERKRARGPASSEHASSASKKVKVLAGAIDPRAQRLREDIEQDMRFQAMLAKKLKLKKGKTSSGMIDDGLDDLLPGSLEELASSMLLPPPLRSAGDTGVSGGARSEESEDDEPDNSHGDHATAARVGAQRPKKRHSLAALPHAMAEDHSDLSPDDSLGSDASGLESSELNELDSGDSEDGDSSESEEGEGGADGFDSDDGQQEQGIAGARAAAPAAPGRYVPPALRKAAEEASRAAGADGAGAPGLGDEPQEHAAARRRVKSLVNRVALANIQGISAEVSDLMLQVPRHVVISAIVDTILQAVEAGPRAADQYASVAASLVAAVAAQARAQDLVAKFLLAIGLALERARTRDDSIASSNLARVICYLHICKVIGSGVVYSLLEVLKDDFTDGDVSLMLTILNVVGFALRAEDAVGMKEFVLSVHAKAAEKGKGGQLSQRARLMLDMVVDIKNNKKGRAAADGQGGRMAALPQDLAKFVRSCGVEEVALSNLTWRKMITCDKKGMWWLPSAGDRPAQELAATVSGSRSEEVKLLKLAAAQRMNTETRRAVFCVLMAADDYMDAFERLMRLPLKGEAERDIIRVILDCCLQEAAWNPYYAHVAIKVASASKNHRMTLQYSIWDKLKLLQELHVRQLTNLAHFLAVALASQTLPLTVLKVVDFADMTAKGALFWRICLQHTLQSVADDAMLQQMFTRVAAQGNLKTLKGGLKLFIRSKLGPHLSSKSAAELQLTPEQHDRLLVRLRLAESALDASATDVVL